MKMNLQELAKPSLLRVTQLKRLLQGASVSGSEELREVNVDVLGVSLGFL